MSIQYDALQEVKAENARLRAEIEAIRLVASGEEQVADNDTEGMGVIARICRRALTAPNGSAEYICTCGIRVEPHRCNTEEDF